MTESNTDSKSSNEPLKEPTPPPPDTSSEFRSKVSSFSKPGEAREVTKTEEPSKKPDWLEELSRKQAVRKSGLFKDSNKPLSQTELKSTPTSNSSSPMELKPVLPTKPSQIRDEGKENKANKFSYF